MIQPRDEHDGQPHDGEYDEHRQREDREHGQTGNPMNFRIRHREQPAQ
jgi:hypothetical protein